MPLTYKQLCIVKHALRDKHNRDDDEEKVYQMLCDVVADFKERNGIDNRSSLNHEPVKRNSKSILK